jgi:hypothetical protein
MNPSHIQTASRKALMAADPLYHSWSPTQQEHFRATMDEAARARVDAVLLKEILGITCTAENAHEVWDGLPIAQLNDLNWAKLLTLGIGEDTIYLNEAMAENVSLLNFETLYDHDFNDHLFQEHANKEQLKDYAGRDYYALRFPPWARLIIDGRFHYSTLYSLARYLLDRIEDEGTELIKTLIPHHYVDGKNHGKPEKSGFLWDMRIDAAGLEGQLEELQDRWHHYCQRRWVELSQSFIDDAPAVFMIDENQDGELRRDFIFNNAAALKRVRWRHFLKDCAPITTDFSAVIAHQETEQEKARHWLRDTHQDIMRNFNPHVVQLKKKHKIIVAPGAFDKLITSDDD